MSNDTQSLPYAPTPPPDAVRPLAEIIADLSRLIHPAFLKRKEKGGANITFLDWHTAADLLDMYAPGWGYASHSQLSLDGLTVVVDVVLHIPTSTGVVTRGASGQGVTSKSEYGAAVTRAESQALRRAAAKFGLARYLYRKPGELVAQQVNGQEAPDAQTTAATTRAPTPRLRAVPYPAPADAEERAQLRDDLEIVIRACGRQVAQEDERIKRQKGRAWAALTLDEQRAAVAAYRQEAERKKGATNGTRA